MAEAFALGEPGPHARARIIAHGLEQLTIAGDDPRQKAALQAAKQTAWAAAHAFRAVTCTPPATPCAKEARKAADTAIAASQDASLEDDHVLLRDSHQKDLNGLTNPPEEFRTAPEDFRTADERGLGPPVDPSRRGLLGSLWAEPGEPRWFKDGLASWRQRFNQPSPLILAHDELEPDSRPDVVVFGPVRGEDSIKWYCETIRRLQSGRTPSRDIPPTLFVYAPGLTEGCQLQLAVEGAIVDTGGPDSMLPGGLDNPEAVKSELSAWFAERYADWRFTNEGMVYEGARATWRMDRNDFSPSPSQSLPHEEAPSLARPEDYQRLVAFLTGGDNVERTS